MRSVFRCAIATGRADHHVTADLRALSSLGPAVSCNHACLTDPVEIGAVLRAIDGSDAQPITAAALKLAALVFVRPGELRGARGPSSILTVLSAVFPPSA